MLRILREIYICASFGFQIQAIHLAGSSNRKADLLFRAPSDPSIKLSDIINDAWFEHDVKDSDFGVLDHW